ncbi:glycosyltransferase family 39 protein [Roseibium aggregatum]|nr:glycosyltransferase family 39 protein [Roseibium aggregatum]
MVLALILAVAALLRFQNLDRTSLWYDEAVSWSQSKGTFTELLTAVAADNYPPLHNILLWLTMPVAGDSETALRLPSVFLGVLAVWLIYLTGKSMAGNTTGLLAAALLTVSPFHIWYSTEARMYALLAACGLAFLLLVLKNLERPSTWRLTGLAIAGALFLYSHIYALLGFASVGVICAILALTGILKSERLGLSNAGLTCLAMAASALAFLPWLIILALRARSVAEEGFWIAYPDPAFLINIAFNMAGSLTVFWVLAGLAVASLLTILHLPGRYFGKPQSADAILVCFAYTAGPPLLAYLYSIFVQPILFDRYLIAAWPGVILLASATAQRLAPRVAPAALLALAIWLSYPELKFTLLEKIRPEWRQIAQDYRALKGEGDHLLLYKGFAAPAVSYYLRDPNAFTAVETVDELGQRAENARWLLIVHTSSEEMRAAEKAFGPGGNSPAARRFGWGASGLTLLERGQAE